jgi:hypothetical protein
MPFFNSKFIKFRIIKVNLMVKILFIVFNLFLILLLAMLIDNNKLTIFTDNYLNKQLFDILLNIAICYIIVILLIIYNYSSDLYKFKQIFPGLYLMCSSSVILYNKPDRDYTSYVSYTPGNHTSPLYRHHPEELEVLLWIDELKKPYRLSALDRDFIAFEKQRTLQSRFPITEKKLSEPVISLDTNTE